MLTQRSRAFPGVQIRAGHNGEPQIVGHAAVFNSESVDLGGWVEIIEPGAFTKTLRDNDDVRALVNHDPSLLLGRTAAKTLRLKVDDKGLGTEIDVPDTVTGRDVVTSMERGDLDGMSFGFFVTDQEWKTIDEKNVRIIQGVKLFDVSVVAFPAFEETDAHVRSLEAFSFAPLDQKQLFAALVRAEHKLPTRKGDRDIIWSAAKYMAGVLPGEQFPSEDDPDASDNPIVFSTSNLRRRLRNPAVAL